MDTITASVEKVTLTENNPEDCIQDTLSSRGCSAFNFRPSARASKDILHTTQKNNVSRRHV